ncbi:MAG: tRNA 2-selenouridine(34) synthase MnmH [Gammaproteobacteria bacterium]
MNELPLIDDFEFIFKNNIPIIDTRAPIEFEKGSFPNAVNMPLMFDEERKEVGTCYKNHGKDKALELGHKLVSGEKKKERVKMWVDFAKKHPNGAIFCFRGGLRSQIAQKWIYENSQISFPKIEGGYKKLRNFLIENIESSTLRKKFIVVGGQTGCGKTILINEIDKSIDLEGIANHRGSAFGNMTSPQPTQINFENKLSIELIKSSESIVLEDEGANIGSVQIPKNFFNKMSLSPLVLLEAAIEERIKISLEDYVENMLKRYMNLDPLTASNNFSNYWEQSLDKIQKRIGLKRYHDLKNDLNLALRNFLNNDDNSHFIGIIEKLLTEYYDPMYSYQISKKKDRIIFSGNFQEVKEFLIS